MIIYFEGLSCAGKTELIKKFLDYFRNDKTFYVKNILSLSEISNLPDDYNCRKNINNLEISNRDCLWSDERKSKLVKKFTGDLLLVDRGYASTLAYNYIDYKLGISKEYPKIVRWYQAGLRSGRLVKPDVYIYLKISKEKSLERSKIIGRYNEKYAWYREPQFAIDYYEKFFKEIENDVPLITVNGENNFDEVFDNALKKYLKLNSGGL